jgi:hypothetical protein
VAPLCGGPSDVERLDGLTHRARGSIPHRPRSNEASLFLAIISKMRAWPASLFQDAIDIPLWLEADAPRPLAERSRRDRAIGQRLQERDALHRVRAWWQQLDRPAAQLPGKRLESARRLVGIVLGALGILSGVGLALAAYRYDGSAPVNVVRLLALLVVPQLLLLLANLLLLIPGRVPGLAAVQNALAAINPGALAAAVVRQLSHRIEATVLVWAAAPSAASRRFAKWQMLHWSQLAAVGFNGGILATAIALVTFTDLAFGWSTTLNVDAEVASRLVRIIAAPWRELVPSAVPDPALVTASQVFRLENTTAAVDSRALAGWWSFSVMAILVYGLLPRLLFLAFVSWRLRRATRALLLDDARVAALLDRLAAPAVETRATAAPAAEPDHEPAVAARSRPALSGTANAIVWNEVVPATTAADLVRTRLGLHAARTAPAGGRSLEGDRAALALAAETRSTVVVLTPAEEPPLLEFTDFLQGLREAVGPSASIIVMPIATGNGQVDAMHRDNWSLAVRRAEDSRAYLETGT